MAIKSRTPPPGGNVPAGLVPSFGTIGDCRQRHDGIVLVVDADRTPGPDEWRTQLDLAKEIFTYIELFYTRTRPFLALVTLTRHGSSAGSQSRTSTPG